jgi:HEAT repeat protein
LRSRRAEPRLQRLFNAERRAQVAARRTPEGDWLPYRIVYLAKALWRIRPDSNLLAAVTEVLESADIELPRMDAAIALEAFRDAAAVRALVKALDDDGKFVRHHAARSLLFIHGRTDETDIVKNGSDHMTYRLMSDDPERRATGKRGLLAAIAGRPIATQP